MGGRGTTVAVLLLAALTTGCDQARDAGPEAVATPLVSVAIPEFEGALDVRVLTGLQVFGLGCRQRTEHDACSADGKTTYTWLDDRPGALRPLTLTRARMHRNAEHTAWVVALRFARTDRGVVRRAAERAAASGGFVLVIDDRTGNALQAVAPEAANGGRIVVRHLVKATAWDTVSGYVTAATPR
jgi:hypothetical protein